MVQFDAVAAVRRGDQGGKAVNTFVIHCTLPRRVVSGAAGSMSASEKTTQCRGFLNLRRVSFSVLELD